MVSGCVEGEDVKGECADLSGHDCDGKGALDVRNVDLEIPRKDNLKLQDREYAIV